MTENDPGHINNLNEKEKEILKECWIELLNVLSENNRLSIEEIVDSSDGDELFNAIGIDNPDVLLLRWIRAKKWNKMDAIEQLIETLTWRKSFNIKNLLKEGETILNQDELQLGKTILLGSDYNQRPVTYIQINKHIKGQFPIESTQLLTIFTVETARKLLRNGNETGTVIIDFDGFSYSKNVDYDFVKFLINLLENHYPESLAVALVINAPYLFNGCWNIIKYWLDPIVQSKIIFLKNLNDLSNYIDLSILQKQFNYIPPSKQDKQIQQDFLNDKQGYLFKRKEHRKASIKFVQRTFQWANDKSNNQLILNQRKKSIKKLQLTSEQLIPYISTQTFYHRIGIIQEPIFHITHQQILQTNQQDENITRF